MKLFKPFLSVVLLITTFYLPSACPIYYVYLSAYVQYDGDYVTKSELKKLNFNDIKDTSHVAIIDKSIYDFSITTKGVGRLTSNYYRPNYELKLAAVDQFKGMMDTILPNLNLSDTVWVVFSLNNTKKQMLEEEFFYNAFGLYKINQRFIISSQAVVDLKRSGPESGMVVYPSPATDNVSVRFDVKEPIEGHITITNALGQIVIEQNQPNLMNVSHFDLKGQKSGSYFVRARIDGEYFTRKIIKE